MSDLLAITAPFDPQQVAALEWFQKGNIMVPLDCPTHTEVLRISSLGLNCTLCDYVCESVSENLMNYAIKAKDRIIVSEPTKKKGKR